jgi:hypothetical protein
VRQPKQPICDGAPATGYGGCINWKVAPQLPGQQSVVADSMVDQPLFAD